MEDMGAERSDDFVSDEETAPLVLTLGPLSLPAPVGHSSIFAWRCAAVSADPEGLRTAEELAPALLVVPSTEQTGPAAVQRVREIRKSPKLAHSVILALAPSSESALVDSLLSAGADDCLPAPICQEELRSSITSLLAAGQLRAAQQRIEALAEQLADGLFLVDRSGRLVEANPAGCRLLQLPRTEILGRTASDFAGSGQAADTLLSTQAELRERGGTRRIDVPLRRADGTVVSVTLHLTRLLDGKLQLLAREDGHRRHAEAASRRAEAQTAALLQISVDAIMSIDAGYRITHWNKGAERMFGYSQTEALGASLDLLIPVRHRARHREHVAHFAASGPQSRIAGNERTCVTGLRKDGSEFPGNASISKVEVDGEKGFSVIFRDVSELRRRENELRFLAEAGAELVSPEHESPLDKIVRAAVRFPADFVLLFTLEPDGRLHGAAAASREATEQPYADRLLAQTHGGALSDFAQQTVRARHALLKVTELEGREAMEASEGLPGANQHPHPFTVLAVPMLAGSGCMGGLLLCSGSHRYDERDLRLSEELGRRCALFLKSVNLHQAERRAVRAREELLGIVAHDLRNPLNTIGLYLDLLVKHRCDTEGRWKKPSEMIRSAALRMDRIIQDLLDVARMENGTLSMELGYVAVAPLLGESAEGHRAQAAAASAELVVEAREGLPAVWADRDRLLQVLDNLISNASKFSRPGATIAVGAAQDGDAVRFWVRDTGVGIPESDLPYLFDRFWQAKRGDRRGIGLGLFIVKSIVTSHGGRVWVESTEGAGSSFFFSIPTRSPAGGPS